MNGRRRIRAGVFRIFDHAQMSSEQMHHVQAARLAKDLSVLEGRAGDVNKDDDVNVRNWMSQFHKQRRLADGRTNRTTDRLTEL